MSTEFATVPLSPYISAQGTIIDRKPDGRVTVDIGMGHVTGAPIRVLTAVNHPTLVDPATEPEFA